MNILLWEFGQSLWNPGKLLALSSRGSSSAAGGTVLLLSVCLKPISHRFHLMFHFFSYYRRWGTVVYYSVTICQVFPRFLQFSYSYYKTRGSAILYNKFHKANCIKQNWDSLIANKVWPLGSWGLSQALICRCSRPAFKCPEEHKVKFHVIFCTASFPRACFKYSKLFKT